MSASPPLPSLSTPRESSWLSSGATGPERDHGLQIASLLHRSRLGKHHAVHCSLYSGGDATPILTVDRTSYSMARREHENEDFGVQSRHKWKLKCAGVVPNGHVQLWRGRQRHPGFWRSASEPQPSLCRAPPSLRRIHLHPGQQPLWPRLVFVYFVFFICVSFAKLSSEVPIAVFGGKSVGPEGGLSITRIVNLTFLRGTDCCS